MTSKNYNQTIRELFDLQKFAIKMGLDNIHALCEYLGQPQAKFESVHIAGTNGKGSTARILQEILTAHGLKTGLYTSPHLVDFRERIRIDNICIAREEVESFWQKVKELVYRRKATFFDTTTAMAFEHFAGHRVDMAVIETGLGGRLDSTNILNPAAAVITPVDFDHEKQLGNNLADIAGEKAGIIKPGIPVFCSVQQPGAELVLRARSENNPFYYLPENVSVEMVSADKRFSVFNWQNKHTGKSFSELNLSLPGVFQVENAALAIQAAEYLLKYKNHYMEESKLLRALENVSWPGRLQRISERPEIILDVSHNVAGVKQTVGFIREHFYGKELKLLIGLLQDKGHGEIARLLAPFFTEVIVTQPQNERYLAVDELAAGFRENGINAKCIKEIDTAFEFCMRQTSADETLFIIGSHFLAGVILEIIQKKLDMQNCPA